MDRQGRRQQERVKKGKLFFVHTILFYWPATLTTVFGAAGDRGMYAAAGGATGAYGGAGPTGMYAAVGATGAYGGAGATGTFCVAGATGAYGGAGATGIVYGAAGRTGT